MRAGYVSLERVSSVISRLVAERWPDHNGYLVLAEKVGCDETAIRHIAYPPDHKASAEFDFVDTLLCALGPGARIWHGELADVYEQVTFVETCSLPSCGKKFSESTRSGKPKRFCSDNCRSLFHKTAAGVATGARNVQRGKCFKGHKMTPENTITTKQRDGSEKRQCRVCRLESLREYKKKRRREDPAWNERQNARRREQRAQRKARVA